MRIIENDIVISGKIKEILPINKAPGVTVVIEGTDRRYNKKNKEYEEGLVFRAINCFGASKDIIDGIAIGDVVTIKCTIQCNEFNNKYYTNLLAMTVIANNYSTAQANRNKYEKEFDSDDDLPFI